MHRFRIDWFKVLIGVAMLLAVLSVATIIFANRAEQQQQDRITKVEVKLDKESQARIQLNCESIQINNQAIIQLHNRIKKLEQKEGLTTPKQLLPQPPKECTGQSMLTDADKVKSDGKKKEASTESGGTSGATTPRRSNPTGPTKPTPTGSKPTGSHPTPAPSTPGPTPTSPVPTTPPPPGGGTPGPNPGPNNPDPDAINCILNSPLVHVPGCVNLLTNSLLEPNLV